ncbi:MAG: hypothetical protein JNM47_11225 [Hyphomonadaceae bacterium]|nr:hypothetical protein [Hyphomonadaceae bacterium]
MTDAPKPPATPDPLGLSSSVRYQITGCNDTPALVEARPKNVSDAQWMFQRLAQAIVAFEKQLDAEHEVGFRLVSFSEAQVFHALDIGFWAPDLILFFGRGPDGAPMQLIQHVSQVSMLLVAAKKQTPEAPPNRIGFEILRKVEDPATPTPTTKIPADQP